MFDRPNTAAVAAVTAVAAVASETRAYMRTRVCLGSHTLGTRLSQVCFGSIGFRLGFS